MKGVRAVSERVAESITRYNMIPSGTRIAIALSSGPDSVLLFHLLRDLAGALGISLSVAHVNHLLRGAESERDEDFARDLARRFDLPFHVHREDARAAGGNLEEDARNTRLRFFRSLIEQKAADLVATGHTRSDQAETVLFRLLRGAYLPGLSGIHPVTSEGLIRPLIDIDRSEVREELRARGIVAREDASNADVQFARNRLRLEVIPWLEREWNPELTRSLATLASLAHDEEQYWAGIVQAESRRIFRITGNSVIVAASELVGLPRALARRLVRVALELVRGDRRQIDFQHVEGILGLAATTVGSGRLQAPGVDVMRSFDWVRFAPLGGGERQAQRYFSQAISIPATVEIPGGGGWIRAELIDSNALKTSPKDSDTVEAVLDWGKLLLAGTSESLTIRTWQPGDEFLPVGGEARVKLKHLFQNERVPLWERSGWPILAVMDEIVWAGSFGVSARVVATDGSVKLLRIVWNKRTAEAN